MSHGFSYLISDLRDQRTVSEVAGDKRSMAVDSLEETAVELVHKMRIRTASQLSTRWESGQPVTCPPDGNQDSQSLVHQMGIRTASQLSTRWESGQPATCPPDGNQDSQSLAHQMGIRTASHLSTRWESGQSANCPPDGNQGSQPLAQDRCKHFDDLLKPTSVNLYFKGDGRRRSKLSRVLPMEMR